MREASDELAELEESGLLRRLRRLDTPQGTLIGGDSLEGCLNFSSNDYLGLANSAEVKAAFTEQVHRHGTGAGASRLVCGTMGAHLELEEKMARLKGSESALTFSSGYATATGVLPALCGKGDIVILDKLCHASLIDGARLSGATLRVFPHNDTAALHQRLQWARARLDPRQGRLLVATESIFSMDGDRAPLREICELKDEAEALLLLDEAHAFGITGPGGRGLAAEIGLEDRVDLQMGTFSKAAGLSGGYLCASRELIDLVINRARSFIYSTAPSPALAATVSTVLDLIEGDAGEARRAKLWANIQTLEPGAESAILPFVLGDNERALHAAAALLEAGFLVPAIRYPTVPRGTARLRVTVSAAHTREQIEALRSALNDSVSTVAERKG